MRKIIANAHVSLDGVMQAPDTPSDAEPARRRKLASEDSRATLS